MLELAELLESVPGLIAVQHSGSGKANQYFLRGFNLDNGTDFTASVDGVPLNLRSHGHGQGYLDINGLMPETVERIDYRKGTLSRGRRRLLDGGLVVHPQPSTTSTRHSCRTRSASTVGIVSPREVRCYSEARSRA